VGFLLLFNSTKLIKTCVKHTDRNTYRLWLEKLKRKRPLGRPRCRREENIKIDINETG
jgi:hypothetical protein